jgi:aminoglycoside phosphotransferase (APT) family kinase protein
MSERAQARSDAEFDPQRLRAFLAEKLPKLTGEMRLQRIGGGQSNPTYFLSFDNARLVLRKRPQGDLPKSAHDVGREFRIISALSGTAVPVPEPILYCEQPDVVGTPFYLMGRLDGRVFMDQSLEEVPASQRRGYYREMARVLAALHAVDWAATDLAGLARPGRYLERQVERWSRVWESQGDAETARIANWLRANVPTTESLAIVHGDYKFTNVIFDPVQPRIAAVLDWELCAIGDPLADLAHMWSALWNTKPQEYGGLLGLDLPASGLPTAEQFMEDYYAAASSSRRVTPFHLVLAHFRNAGIFRGIGERAAAGIANATDAAQTGRLDRVYIRRALAVVEQQAG